MTEDQRRKALDAIAAEVSACTRCRLHQTRTRAVPGEGHPDTEVVFVGEGPGFNEDRQGRPFVGQAGTLLEKLLLTLGWTRKEVFIANVVKCRPPENRDPEPDEIAACGAFLTRQLEVLDPALVVTLGRYSMARFNPGAKISQVHGTYREAAANSGAPSALVYFMYHPAAALRDSGVEAASYRDAAGIPAALLEARKRRAMAGAPAGATNTATSAAATAEATAASQAATHSSTNTPANPATIPAKSGPPSGIVGSIDRPTDTTTPPAEPQPEPDSHPGSSFDTTEQPGLF